MAKKKAEVKEVIETVEQPEKDNDLSELDALIEAEAPEEQKDDYNPEDDENADKQAIAANQAAEAAATGQSMVAVAVISQIIDVIRPDLTVSEDQKKQVQVKLQPVLLKYSTGGVPPWLLKYREELELAGVLGMVGFSMFQQVKAAEAANDKTGGEDGEQSQSEAS